jgi:hypothetical protein
MEEFEKLVSESFQSDLLPADDRGTQTSDQNPPEDRNGLPADAEEDESTEDGPPAIKTAS